MSDPTRYLGWVARMLKTSVAGRSKWMREIIDGIRSYRKTKKKSEEYLTDLLLDEKLFELIGFACNSEYIKAEGPSDELDCVWVHPYASPTAMYKHKSLPIIVIAGPGLRKDSSILNEVKDSRVLEDAGIFTGKVRGITG